MAKGLCTVHNMLQLAAQSPMPVSYCHFVHTMVLSCGCHWNEHF